MLAYILGSILVMPAAWFFGWVIEMPLSLVWRKLIPLSFGLFLNGIIDGLIACYIAKLLFAWLSVPFNPFILVIIGVEFGLIAFDGIMRLGIYSYLPTTIGMVIGLIVLLIF